MPDIPAFEQSNDFVQPQVHYNSDFNPFKSFSGESSPSSARPQYERASAVDDWQALYGGSGRPSKMNSMEMPNEPVDEVEEYTAPTETIQAASSLYTETATVETTSQYFQLKGRFILTSVKSGLMLIDQHRAHVRVLFDRYLNQIAQKKGNSQGMLFPEILQIPASEVAVLDSINEELTSLGFDISNLGGGSYAINSIPDGIEGLNPVELIHNMIHSAQEKGCDVREEVQSLLAQTMAKSSAIVYGQVLTNAEMSNLIDSLFACQFPNYTPDGKVVLHTIKEDEIDKLFK